MRIIYSQRDRGLLAASLEDFKKKLDVRLSAYPDGGKHRELPQVINRAIRDGLEELNLTGMRDMEMEIDFVFADLLRKKKVTIKCLKCAQTISPDEVRSEKWEDLAPPEALASAWGRIFKCPKGHTLLATFDQIS